MLWYKGWLETRFRLVFVLVVIAFMFIAQSSGGSKVDLRPTFFFAGMAVWMICVFVAAAGMVTQQSLQAAKGLHGSTLFTLSLPVTRLRLLAVRAGLGWLEMAVGVATICCLLWFLFPAIRGMTTRREMAEFAAVLIVCGSAFYCITVLLSVFLDDLWRVWGSFICYGAIWWLSDKIHLPASFNPFVAMGDGSPVYTHAMPWTAMASSLGVAIMLLFAALKVAEAREY